MQGAGDQRRGTDGERCRQPARATDPAHDREHQTRRQSHARAHERQHGQDVGQLPSGRATIGELQAGEEGDLFLEGL